jgi:ribosomal protein S18 acetylase RimI-like enzyme
MPAQQVKIATQRDVDQCVALIVLAFSSDPAARWLYPDPSQFLTFFPRFVRAFGGKAFESGSAHLIDRSAAALWFPPGVQPGEEELVELIKGSVPKSDQDIVFAVLEEMGGYHPKEPHWYLPLIGTDPTQQGNGHGSALLRHALALCDEQKMPAYLEATSRRSVPLYQRHGFEILGAIQVNSASPAITPMLRKPHSGS